MSFRLRLAKRKSTVAPGEEEEEKRTGTAAAAADDVSVLERVVSALKKRRLVIRRTGPKEVSPIERQRMTNTQLPPRPIGDTPESKVCKPDIFPPRNEKEKEEEAKVEEKKEASCVEQKEADAEDWDEATSLHQRAADLVEDILAAHKKFAAELHKATRIRSAENKAHTATMRSIREKARILDARERLLAQQRRAEQQQQQRQQEEEEEEEEDSKRTTASSSGRIKKKKRRKTQIRTIPRKRVTAKSLLDEDGEECERLERAVADARSQCESRYVAPIDPVWDEIRRLLGKQYRHQLNECTSLVTLTHHGCANLLQIVLSACPKGSEEAARVERNALRFLVGNNARVASPHVSSSSSRLDVSFKGMNDAIMNDAIMDDGRGDSFDMPYRHRHLLSCETKSHLTGETKSGPCECPHARFENAAFRLVYAASRELDAALHKSVCHTTTSETAKLSRRIKEAAQERALAIIREEYQVPSKLANSAAAPLFSSPAACRPHEDDDDVALVYAHGSKPDGEACSLDTTRSSCAVGSPLPSAYPFLSFLSSSSSSAAAAAGRRRKLKKVEQRHRLSDVLRTLTWSNPADQRGDIIISGEWGGYLAAITAMTFVGMLTLHSGCSYRVARSKRAAWSYQAVQLSRKIREMVSRAEQFPVGSICFADVAENHSSLLNGLSLSVPLRVTQLSTTAATTLDASRVSLDTPSASLVPAPQPIAEGPFAGLGSSVAVPTLAKLEPCPDAVDRGMNALLRFALMSLGPFLPLHQATLRANETYDAAIQHLLRCASDARDVAETDRLLPFQIVSSIERLKTLPVASVTRNSRRAKEEENDTAGGVAATTHAYFGVPEAVLETGQTGGEDEKKEIKNEQNSSGETKTRHFASEMSRLARCVRDFVDHVKRSTASAREMDARWSVETSELRRTPRPTPVNRNSNPKTPGSEWSKLVAMAAAKTVATTAAAAAPDKKKPISIDIDDDNDEEDDDANDPRGCCGRSESKRGAVIYNSGMANRGEDWRLKWNSQRQSMMQAVVELRKWCTEASQGNPTLPRVIQCIREIYDTLSRKIDYVLDDISHVPSAAYPHVPTFSHHSHAPPFAILPPRMYHEIYFLLRKKHASAMIRIVILHVFRLCGYLYGPNDPGSLVVFRYQS